MGSWFSYGLGSGKRGSARVHRYDVAGIRQTGMISPCTIDCGEAGFCRTNTRALSCRGSNDPVLYPEQSARGFKPLERAMLDDVADVERKAFGSGWSTRKSTRGSRSMRCHSACRLRCRIWSTSRMSRRMPIETYGPDVKKPGSFANNCLLRPPDGPARCPVHTALSPGLGSTQQSAPPDPRTMRGHRPAQRGAGEGPEAARAAGRYPGDLGRGVWADRLLPGEESEKDIYGRDHHGRCYTIGWREAASNPAPATE